MLEVAVRAAKKAGEITKKYFRHIKSVKYKKHITNLVTKVDYMCEDVIIKTISDKFPSHSFLSEETGRQGLKSEYLWVIDPLDGTVNYAHGFPVFSISIALLKDGETVLGVVYEPILNELFVAEKNKNARLNGKVINVSKKKDLKRAFLATGFSYTIHFKSGSQFLHFEKFCKTAQAVRRAGSAALDICYVACGVFDGFWELDLHPWDTAAGCLILQEAGGKISDYKGNEFNVFKKELSLGITSPPLKSYLSQLLISF